MQNLTMRGFFAIGAEGISKPVNLGGLLRTANAFGAAFVFVVDPDRGVRQTLTDTSQAEASVPLYELASVTELRLPRGCRLVGCELAEAAIELPSFRHPTQAAYVFGPERGSLSPSMVERCDFVVRIPTRFCLNLTVAGAIVMYDRMLSHGRFAERPVRAGGPHAARPAHRHGSPVLRRTDAPG